MILRLAAALMFVGCAAHRAPRAVSQAASSNAAQPPRSAYVRLCFAAQTPDRIEEGVKIFGQLIRDHLRRRDMLAARACRETEPLM